LKARKDFAAAEPIYRRLVKSAEKNNHESKDLFQREWSKCRVIRTRRD